MFFIDCIHQKVRCWPSHSFNGERVPFLPTFFEIFFAFSGLWHCIRHLAKISWTFLPSIDKWEIESWKNEIERNFFCPRRFMATYRQSAKNFLNFFPPQVLGGTFEPKFGIWRNLFHFLQKSMAQTVLTWRNFFQFLIVIWEVDEILPKGNDKYFLLVSLGHKSHFWPKNI